MQDRGADLRVRLDAGGLDLSALRLGDSIAVAGVCLTVAEQHGREFGADVSQETLQRTTWGQRRPGDRVNLELALTLSTPLGGHLVSGHVDGVGVVRRRETRGRSEHFVLEAPPELRRYIAQKGSIGVDGVSLTVNAVNADGFEVNLVPHTLTATTLGALAVGSEVNLEVDLLARYLERLLNGAETTARDTPITHAFLARHGFLK